jgi:hypothetical protein
MIVVATQSIPVTAAKRGKGRPSRVPTALSFLPVFAKGETLTASVHGHVEITASTSTGKSKKNGRKQPNVEKVAAVFNMSPLKMLSATTAATISAAAPAAAIDARAVAIPNAVTIAANKADIAAAQAAAAPNAAAQAAAAPNAAAQAGAAPNTTIQAVAALAFNAAPAIVVSGTVSLAKEH